jgi:3-methyladenine DNA glycosylase AlkD
MLGAVATPRSPLATTLLKRLDMTYAAAADPVRAVGARAYMRDQFPIFGITNPRLHELDRSVLAGLDPPTEADLVATALGCWDRPEREFQYFACGYLRAHVGGCAAGFLGTVRLLVVTKSWWDTVDTLAAHTVGPLVTRHPELAATMDAWVAEENMWLVRTAILHQLRYKQRTDADRLFAYCTAQAGHRDFFIRKAIGWALREYARTDPEAVRSFVHEHSTRLSPLSVREALKNITPRSA